MKRITIFAAFLLLGAAVCSAETITASDARTTWIGRTETTADGAVSFDWSATTVRLRFTGTTLTLTCTDTRADWFNLWVDTPQGPQATSAFRVAGDTTITLFKGRKGTHEVCIQKRTEGEQGTAVFNSFTTDGSFLDAPKPHSRLIEFIGDSYTCGYGTEAPDRDDPFLPETENPALTYADIVARLFDAEAVHISHSGRGVVRNYDDFNQHENMVKLYPQAYDQHCDKAWTPTYSPDLVVIYLGTNDFSTGRQPSLGYWCDGYGALLRQVRAFYGEQVPIILMASKADEQMGLYVKAAGERSGLGNLHYCIIQDSAHNQDSDLGASWHPNYKGHRKIASILAPYVATATGWDFPFKPFE